MRRLRLSGRIRVVLVLSLFLAFVISMPVRAASFTVTTNGDTGDTSPGDGNCVATGGGCTLRAALQEANALAGADSITINAVGTISVGSQLVASESVTISTSAIGNVTVQAGASPTARRNLLIGSETVTASPTVTITNVIFTNGRGAGNVAGATSNRGGCIFVASGATLTLDHSVVRGCQATGDGGGIYGDGGAGGAGASTINLINTTTVRSNTTGGDGGGVFTQTGTVAVQSSACVRDNSAVRGGGIGGGDDTYVIVGVTGLGYIMNNTASSGGGVYLAVNSSFQGNGARFYNNNGSGLAGAAWQSAGGDTGNVSGFGRSCVNCCIVQNNNPYSGTSYAVYQPNDGDVSTWNGNWWGSDYGPQTPDYDPALGVYPYTGSFISNGDSINGNGTASDSISRIQVTITDYGDSANYPQGSFLTLANAPADCQAYFCTAPSSQDPSTERSCSAPTTCGLGN